MADIREMGMYSTAQPTTCVLSRHDGDDVPEGHPEVMSSSAQGVCSV
jgi:hypothetical protein